MMGISNSSSLAAAAAAAAELYGNLTLMHRQHTKDFHLGCYGYWKTEINSAGLSIDNTLEGIKGAAYSKTKTRRRIYKSSIRITLGRAYRLAGD